MSAGTAATTRQAERAKDDGIVDGNYALGGGASGTYDSAISAGAEMETIAPGWKRLTDGVGPGRIPKPPHCENSA